MIADPVEKDIAYALTLAGVRYIHEADNKEQNLDFYLPDFGCYIECKAYHTNRTERQIEGKQVILVQGYKSAKALIAILQSTRESE